MVVNTEGERATATVDCDDGGGGFGGGGNVSMPQMGAGGMAGGGTPCGGHRAPASTTARSAGSSRARPPTPRPRRSWPFCCGRSSRPRPTSSRPPVRQARGRGYPERNARAGWTAGTPALVTIATVGKQPSPHIARTALRDNPSSKTPGLHKSHIRIRSLRRSVGSLARRHGHTLGLQQSLDGGECVGCGVADDSPHPRRRNPSDPERTQSGSNTRRVRAAG